MADDIVTRLRVAVPDSRACRDAANTIVHQDTQIQRLQKLIADLLEWADHQADCLIHDDDICDCGYDALAAEWVELRRG